MSIDFEELIKKKKIKACDSEHYEAFISYLRDQKKKKKAPKPKPKRKYF